MNIAVIGSGGREHALAVALKRSKSCDNLFCYPGNPGTEHIATNVPITYTMNTAFLESIIENNIKLVVVGPEIPLVEGITDILEEQGFAVFGPSKAASAIEADKSFAKKIMINAGVPTAYYKEFTSKQYSQAKEYLEHVTVPIVLKANGLAAGKGVAVCASLNEAIYFLDSVFSERIFGSAGDTLIIEEFMDGVEASLFVVTDGKDYTLLPSAQDHKRIGDGDTGKNTGGMGAYAPASVVTEEILASVKKEIIEPTLRALRNEGMPFKGCLYCGLMITEQGPKVVEFNCRFGDPETQVVLPLIDGDLAQLFYSVAIGKLDATSITISNRKAVCVVLASGGYPDSFEKGKLISGLNHEFESNILVYHAGTRSSERGIETSGGRVLSVTAITDTTEIRSAIDTVYNAIKSISFDGMYFRTDIAHRAL